jgi:hypothetical protein
VQRFNVLLCSVVHSMYLTVAAAFTFHCLMLPTADVQLCAASVSAVTWKSSWVWVHDRLGWFASLLTALHTHASCFLYMSFCAESAL